MNWDQLGDDSINKRRIVSKQRFPSSQTRPTFLRVLAYYSPFFSYHATYNFVSHVLRQNRTHFFCCFPTLMNINLRSWNAVIVKFPSRRCVCGAKTFFLFYLMNPICLAGVLFTSDDSEVETSRSKIMPNKSEMIMCVEDLLFFHH